MLYISYPFLETGCRKFYPGQWTYAWTDDYKEPTWSNFADAYAACKPINCGSIDQSHNGFNLRIGDDLNTAGPIPNDSHGPGCWLRIIDTRSTYCDD